MGYDENRDLIIFPISKNCYFGRSIVNDNKIKNPGVSEIWNKQLLKNSNKNTLIYLTEGIIDSLSLEVVDSNIKTISMNGITNINQLIKLLKDENYKGTIIIAFDNDIRGKNASKKLEEELAKINVNSFSNTLISNFDINKCNDLNEALLLDKDKLKSNYEYANNNYKIYLEKLCKKEGVEIEC